MVNSPLVRASDGIRKRQPGENGSGSDCSRPWGYHEACHEEVQLTGGAVSPLTRLRDAGISIIHDLGRVQVSSSWKRPRTKMVLAADRDGRFSSAGGKREEEEG